MPQSKWKVAIQSLGPQCEFFAPALWADVTSAENLLAVRFPEPLRELLLETNGIHGEFGLGLIWPVERICRENQDFRENVSFQELYMPFDSLLFFGDAGNGDQFAFSILNGTVRHFNIYVWNHEDDGRACIDPSLEKYLEGMLNGTIRL